MNITSKESKRAKFVFIHWIDAHWDADGGDVKPVAALTPGWLVADEPDFLRVSGEIFEGGAYRQTTAIPKGMIQQVIELKKRLPFPFNKWKKKEV